VPETLDRRAFGQRLRRARKAKGLTLQQLGRAAGLSRQRLSKYEKGEHLPDLEVLVRIAGVLGESVSRLLDTGGIAGRMPAELTLAAGGGRAEQFEAVERVENYVPVPLLRDEVAGGAPREVNEDDVEGFAIIYQAWCSRPQDYTVVRVAGDSMHPVLEDGSLVAINHRQRNPRLLDGKIVAFRKNGGATVKVCHFVQPDLVIGKPANPDSREFVIFRGEEVNDCVIGKVEWWWGRQA